MRYSAGDLPGETRGGAQGAPSVLDLRGVRGARLRWPAGDVVVISGLPGGGKSTLLRRLEAREGPPRRIDSQDVRESWQRRLPYVPYAVVRPLVRLEHYLRLWRALRSSSSVAVHDCGQRAWVRRWLAWAAGRAGRDLHMLFLDVTEAEALRGQRSRGRTVSYAAFVRHRRAMAQLREELLRGRLPTGCRSVVLLDRVAARMATGIVFETEVPHAAVEVPHTAVTEVARVAEVTGEAAPGPAHCP